MADNELFGEETGAEEKPVRNGNGKSGNGRGAKKAAEVVNIAPPPATATVAVMEAPVAAAEAGQLTAFQEETSTEPGGAAPLMAAPTSPANLTAPVLPERIQEARSGQNAPDIFAGEGLTFPRHFTKAGEDVFDTTEWDYRTAAITDEKGKMVFEQKDCEIPKGWSMLATNVVVSKYFRGKVGAPGRENSVKQLISRVADTIHAWGKKGNYFATDEDAAAFHDELRYLLLHQHMAFNSPVWFNLGVPGERPQVSACQPYDALVSTPQGLIPLGRLVEENAVGTPVYDAYGVTRIVATKANGRKNVLRLHTKAGYTLDVTADHLVWKVARRQNLCKSGKFVEAGTLGAGDQLAWVRTPLAGKSLEDSPEEAEAALAGWLQCDGFVGQYASGTNRSLTIEALTVNADEEAWVRSALEQVFPNAHSHTHAIITQDEKLDGKRIRLYGEALCPFIEKWNLMARGTAMQVPPEMFAAPYAVAAAYLRSLFQAEGYAILRENASIGIDMISEEMMRGVQRLLLRFGIYSRLRYKADSREDRKGCWCLKIATLGDRKRFAAQIGFIGAAKQEKVLASLGMKGLEEGRHKTLEIAHVENLGEMEVYDIQTESGEYLSGNVRVHNCFINSVDDTMESILTLAKTEGMLFKWGSGTGTNFSVLRSSKEGLKGGGTASGPVSFMRGFDSFAGAIKSGGKCFKKGTLISTPEGWIPIETLQIGDMALTHDGPRPIADFMPNGVKQCYNVRTAEGYELEVTRGHKFAFWNDFTGKYDVKPIEDFEIGEAMYVLTEATEGGIAIPLFVPEAHDGLNADSIIEMTFPTELNDEMGYVLGLMYGDAELRTTYPHRVRVTFCKDEAGRVSADRFRAYCKNLFGEYPLLLTDEKNYQSLGFTRKRLIEFLVANNVAKGKANALRFPKALFQAKAEVRAAFIAGVIDADGTYQRRGGWNISSVDREFLVEMQRLLLTLGVPSKLRLNREAKGRWQNLYRLHIVGHTFIARMVERINPYSAKAQINYVPSPGADKGWGYRPSQLPALVSRIERRGGYHLIERKVGINETTGYGALAVLATTHPHAAVAAYAHDLSRCVQVTLESVTPTEMAETYDIEVEGVHLLCANGLYASNTRRAAKMVILNSDHPDIEEFIECKADAEKKAHSLIEAGYSGAFNVANGAYDSVYFQNANHSVRATDDFMRAVELDRDWSTIEVLTGKINETFRARDLMKKIAEATWVCGDPGMQFDTAANRWHTCPNSGRINASNPCCFTGDTLVAVADGRDPIAFRDLAGQIVPVYAWDHKTGKTVIAEMHNIGIKRKGTKVFRVTLDDGSSFRATDDHLIMLRDGSYRQVKDLNRGDSLNPFHSKVRAHADSRSKRRYVHTGGGWKAQYRWIWETANGVQPESFHIHHRDFNSLNDALTNLELLPEAEHTALHRDKMIGDNNPARRLMNDTWRLNISRAVSGENNPHYGKPHGDETRAKMREASAARWSDPNQREHAADAANHRVAKARSEGKPLGRTPGERFERACPGCRQNFMTAREEQIFCSQECRYSPLGRAMIGEKGGATRTGRPLSATHRESLRASSKAAARPEDKRRAAQESLRARCLKAARLLTDARHKISLSDWAEMRDTARTLGAAHVPHIDSVLRFFASDAELREATALYNHKVVSVEFDGEEDVYDGTVEGHHNFAIVTSNAPGIGGAAAPDYSGVFVHNSEYFFLDDSACNLASLNLMRFRTPSREFDSEAFQSAVRVTITAMEIMVGNAAYPTDKITINSFDYRPLGLGYANLGALLMARGLGYDSDEGRAYAAAITAIMSGTAYHQSAKVAGRVGAFAGFEKNRQPMLRVMQMHRDHIEAIHAKDAVPVAMVNQARKSWDEAIHEGEINGYRNSQISVLAPTGCLVAGSMVLTDRGLMRLDRLGDVNGRQWQNVNFNVLTDEGQREATKFYVNGVELTRRLVTKAGFAIQGTLKHRIKVVDTATGQMVWKRFADIAPNDVVALSMGQLVGQPRTVNLPPLGEEYWTGDYTTKAPRTMTPELAELIGYFMGDGSLHSKGPRFCVANADTDVAARVKTLVKTLFNLDAHITPQEGYQEVAVHSVPLTLWWEACGFAKRSPSVQHSGKGYVPHIPDAVLATNDPATYGAFLRGLYEADGTVTNGVPCWTTVQRSFSEEVKTLLLALGVPTVSRETQTGWGNSTAYCLRLRNSSYGPIFLNKIGFMGERKAARIAVGAGEQTARHDYIYLAPETIEELVPQGHALYSAVYQAQRRHDGAITRRAANALYAETSDARIGHALNFFYDAIASNEDGGEQLTYDLSVPSNVTYIAQGFISHNTIGFLMDCDTTGVEPDIAIVKYKSLVGGGMFKIVNQTVPEALERLGYSAGERKAILDYIEANDTIEGAPGLNDDHLIVFDCAFRAKNGKRTIHYMGHIKMMAAVQPFLSGAISKTVNMPTDANADDIAEAYMQAWKAGVKALAIYRDGSKKTQPLSTGKADDKPKEKDKVEARPLRRKLPDERHSLTHKFSVGGHEGYLTIGMYPEGDPGEIFITMSKEGSVVSGLMDSFATAISLSLQYGVPLKTLVDKFMHSRFEPSGFTGNPDIPMAKSIMDYLFRYMALKFLNKDERGNVGLIADQPDEYDSLLDDNAPTLPAAKPSSSGSSLGSAGQAGPAGVPSSSESRTQAAEKQVFVTQSDAPPCPDCGSITTRNGACYRCANCGTSIGCS